MSKRIPTNALTSTYTKAMLDSDLKLANIFGGPNAVAAASGFEPVGLASQYPLYRGDVIGDDGQLHRGHLSFVRSQRLHFTQQHAYPHRRCGDVLLSTIGQSYKRHAGCVSHRKFRAEL